MVEMTTQTLKFTVLATATALALGACSDSGVSSSSAGNSAGDSSQSAQEATALKPQLVDNAREFFFPQAKKLALATPEFALPAAKFAVAQGMPLHIATDITEVDLQGVKEIVTYGSVDTTGFSGSVVPAERPVAGEDLGAYARAKEIAAQPTTATAAVDNTGATGEVTALVTYKTDVGDIATARAAGAKVLVLTVGDPREITESMRAVNTGNTVALGPDFGSDKDFEAKVALAANGELPGGGGLVFPGRRMIAFYGHPSGPALGVMGEQDPVAAVARVKELVAQYQELTGYPVIPAFEIIATVASGAPGDDGDYANETEPSDIEPYIDAITQAGGYAVLDLQPGRASLLEQAKIYEDLLKRPNVGLALDPEWKIGPTEVPMTDIGHVEAAEVDEVSAWLAQLVRENNLPQKALVLHQFQLQMIRDREKLNLNHPELAFILHADGHGNPGTKLETWNALRQDLDPRFFMAWKNFIDEDSPMYTPAETFSIDPRPWFVSYQ